MCACVCVFGSVGKYKQAGKEKCFPAIVSVSVSVTRSELVFPASFFHYPFQVSFALSQHLNWLEYYAFGIMQTFLPVVV